MESVRCLSGSSRGNLAMFHYHFRSRAMKETEACTQAEREASSQMNGERRPTRSSALRGLWGIHIPKSGHSALGITSFVPGKDANSFLARRCGMFTEPRKCLGVHLARSSSWLMIIIARVYAREDKHEGKERVLQVTTVGTFTSKAPLSTDPLHRQSLRRS